MAKKEETVELKRTLGTSYLIFMALGGIFGTGIYSMSASIIGLVGDAVWMPMAFMFILSLLDAFVYTEFGLLYPRMATTFVYIKEGFGGKIGEAFSWINAMSSLFSSWLSSAMVATSSGAYAVSAVKIFTGIDIDPTWAVAVMMLAAYFLNYIGVTPAILAGDIMTALELFVVFMLILIGMLFPARTPDYFVSSSVGNFALALAMARFAYGGYASPLTYIEEAKEPMRTIPKSIIGSVIITVFGYVFVVIAMVRMQPPSVLAFAPNPFVVSTSSVLGGLAVSFFALFGALAAFKGQIFGLGGRARFLAGMSREGFLPKALGRISARGIPAVSLTLYLVILMAGNFFGGYMGAFAWLVKATAVTACITMLFVPVASILHHLRKETRDMKRPWKQPFVVKGVPLCAVVVIIYAVFIMVNIDFASLVPAIVSYILAIALYFVWLLRGGKRKDAKPS